MQGQLEAERLVHWDPGDDAWVVPIPVDGLGELVQKALLRFVAVGVKVWHLGPDQETEPVGPVQPSGIFNLLMLPSAIETERLRQLDVPAQIGIGSGGVPATWKVPLVEDEPLNERLAVEEEAPVLSPHSPQTEVTLDTVDLLPLVIERHDDQVVEPGRVRVPGHNFREGEPAGARSQLR